ncbi:MAG: hypothetical protein ACREHV_17115 [Rhizomicrobium sp.]
MNPNEMPEPYLSPDFAARVLLRSDVLRARRRTVVAGVAAASFAAIAAVAWTGFSRLPDASEARREPVTVTVAAASPANQAEEAAALSYLFPDAGPVARFAAQYSDATDNASDGTDLFADQDADAP